MKCEDWTLQINALLDGQLPAAEAAALTAHLKTCPACTQMLDELAALRGAIVALDHDAQPSDALRARIEAVMAGSQPELQPQPQPQPQVLRPRFGAGRRFALVLGASAALAATLLLLLFPGKDIRPDLMSVRDAALRGGLTQQALAGSPAVPGFTLVGTHRDMVAGHRADVALYRRGEAIVTLCVWPAGREPAHGTRQSLYRGMTIAYWNDGQTEYWAASAAPGPVLADFVQGLQANPRG